MSKYPILQGFIWQKFKTISKSLRFRSGFCNLSISSPISDFIMHCQTNPKYDRTNNRWLTCGQGKAPQPFHLLHWVLQSLSLQPDQPHMKDSLMGTWPGQELWMSSPPFWTSTNTQLLWDTCKKTMETFFLAEELQLQSHKEINVTKKDSHNRILVVLGENNNKWL